MNLNLLIGKNDKLVIVILSLISFVILSYVSKYIDFHADEAIYYDAIVMNLRNDSGLFYIVYYSFIGKIISGVEGARIGSALLGGLTLFMILNIFKEFRFSAYKNYLIIALVFSLSYQSFFLFDRVRPEASWWFITSMLFYSLVRFSLNSNSIFNISLLSLSIVLLPMNHRLTWFICIFLIGYIILFLIKEIGWKKSLLLFSLIFLGIFLNIFIRGLALEIPIYEAIKMSFSGTDMGKINSIREFLNNIFFAAPYFLNDKAANLNFYEYFFGVRNWTSHNFVQNSYLFMMLILPFFSRGLKSFYIFSLPLGSFIGFYLSGYFNPTYVPGFTIVILLYILYIAFTREKIKYFAYLLLMISLINGASFLTTRIFSHGVATYYQSLNKIKNTITENGNIQSIALPERFIPAIRDIKVKNYVTFKNDIPKDVDLLIVDDYDYLMYAFVPEHKDRLKNLEELMGNMCQVYKENLPVYLNDYIFNEIENENTVLLGSWFFRNSSTYNLSIYKRCKNAEDK